MTKLLFAVVFVILYLDLCKAEYCGYYNGHSWYCDIANTYCCGYRNGVALCCEYDPFYTWWYFWLGMVGLIFLLSALIALCRRRRMRRMHEAAMRRNVQTATIVQQSQPTGGYQNPNFSLAADSAPPPYPAGTVEQKEHFPPPPYNPQDYGGVNPVNQQQTAVAPPVHGAV